MSTDERIKVLGTGCKKCDKLENNVYKALAELGKEDIVVGHVKDVIDIANYGVMMTPALVIDGKAVSSGKVLNVEEVKELLNKKL